MCDACVSCAAQCDVALAACACAAPALASGIGVRRDGRTCSANIEKAGVCLRAHAGVDLAAFNAQQRGLRMPTTQEAKQMASNNIGISLSSSPKEMASRGHSSSPAQTKMKEAREESWRRSNREKRNARWQGRQDDKLGGRAIESVWARALRGLARRAFQRCRFVGAPIWRPSSAAVKIIERHAQCPASRTR